MKIAPEQVRGLFDYRDGALIWRARHSHVGQLAGNAYSKHGYLRARFRGRNYMLHHLVWAWHHGAWPPIVIDHLNGNPADNRIENLRLANRSQNEANGGRRGKHKKGASPRRNGRWVAQITVNFRNHYLGSFDTEDEAHAAYMDAARRHFGNFARAA